jgi:hypothetical protein
MPDQTIPERIIALFEHLWPTDNFHVDSDFGSQTVSIRVLSKDLMTTYARIRFEPKSWVSQTKAYKVDISYAAFNGPLEEMVDSLKVITTVTEVLKKIQETALIKGET